MNVELEKRCGSAETARMFAWKQQSFKECVTAHWSSSPAWIINGHKRFTEALGFRNESVGEHILYVEYDT